MAIQRRKVFGLVVCAAVAFCIALGFYAFAADRGAGDGLALDENAVTGLMPGVDKEKRKEELQQKLDASMIAFSVNTNPVFADGSAEGNLLIENPEQNEKLLVAEIYLDGTQELIYRSGAIPPGSYIASGKIDKALPAGEYPATIYLKGYSLEDENYIGQAGASIRLHVEQ